MPTNEQLFNNESNHYEQSNTASDKNDPKDKSDIDNLFKIFNRYKKARNRYDKKWMHYYRMFRGKQWSAKRPKWFSSEIVNFVFQAIQSQAPLQTDARPKFTFIPEEPSDTAFARVLEKVSDSDWEKHNWLATVFEVLLDGYIYGTGISSMSYDHTIDNGLGAPVYKSEEPFYCYPDPDCNDFNDSESEGFIYAAPVNTCKLKRQHPKFAPSIKSDVRDFVKSSKTDIYSDRFGYFNSDKELPEFTQGQAPESDGRTMVYRFYLKPKELEEIKEENEEGETYTIKKKYPNGRYVIIANGIKLVDSDLEYEDNLIPFSKYNNYILPREFWGISEIEQLESPQKVFNKILAFTLDAYALMGNPIWIVDYSSGLDPSSMHNVPGAVYEKEKGTEVRREQGVGVNPGALQLLNQMADWFNQVGGQSEFARGNAPGGVTAASAIEQLISTSRIRIRQKQRNLDAYMKTVGVQYSNRVFEFYTVPRLYRMTNDDGSQSYLKFHIEKDDTLNQKAALIQEYRENEEGNFVGSNVEKLILKGNLDIRVKTGSDLPFEAADKENKALALFDRGIIDAEEVLDQLQYPNKEKILQRVREQADVMAAQQQTQQTQ